jgi:Ca-activated chloride channel family protein
MIWRFEHINYLYWLPFVLGALLLMYYGSWYYSKIRMKNIGNSSLVKSMLKNYCEKSYWLNAILFILATLFLFIALANPQLGNESEKVKAKGADVFIIFDISNSMLAEDVAPSRISKAKNVASKIIGDIKGNRIALIYFAGSAFLQMPLTLDYGAANMLIQSANTTQIGTQGSSLTEAFSIAERADNKEDNAQNIILVISDLETHDDDAVSKAKELARDGWMINVLGVGTEQGGFIPMDQYGVSGYKRDENGEVVKTKLNKNLMDQLADVGNGISVNITDSDASKKLFDRINDVKTGEVAVLDINSYKSIFQYFLFISILLYMMYFLSPFNKLLKVAGFILLAMSMQSNLYAQKEASIIRHGNRLYKSEKYDEAASKYSEALRKENHPTTQYNLGTAQYKAGKYEEAIASLESSIKPHATNELKAKAYFNLGNAYLKSNKLDESIDHYKEALRYDKNDQQAKENLLKAKWMKKQQQNQENKDKQQQNKEQNKDQNKEEKQDQDNKNNKNKDQNKDKQNQQNQNNSSDHKKDKADGKEPSKLTKEQQQKLADFVKSEEQKVQQKIQRGSARRPKNGKDW